MNDNKNIPTHVSIIMDGNGRWAGLHGKERVAGHFEGVESVRVCVETAVEVGVRYLPSSRSPKRTGDGLKARYGRSWSL